MKRRTHSRWIHGFDARQMENLKVRQGWLSKVITMPKGLFGDDETEAPNEGALRATLLTRLRRMLHYLPDRERSFLELYYIKGKSQGQIATVYGVTQEAICYRLKRAKERLKFIDKLVDILDSNGEMVQVHADLDLIFKGDRFLATVMKEFLRFSSQSRVAKKLRRSTFKVRLTLQDGVKRLQASSKCPTRGQALRDRLKRYLKIYRLMMSRYLILVEKQGKWRTPSLVLAGL